MLASKILIANVIKKERLKNERRKNRILKSFELKNHIKKVKVKYNEEVALKKIKAYKTQKIEMSKLNHSLKIINEKRMIKKRERSLLKMEQVEKKLLIELKNTEKLQNDTLKKCLKTSYKYCQDILVCCQCGTAKALFDLL